MKYLCTPPLLLSRLPSDILQWRSSVQFSKQHLSVNPILQNRYLIMVKCLNIGKNIGKTISRSLIISNHRLQSAFSKHVFISFKSFKSLWISNKCYISQMLWKINYSAVKSSEVCICSLHKRVCVTVRLSVCIRWVWSCHTIDKLESLDFKRCSTISSLPLCCIHIIFTVCCMWN